MHSNRNSHEFILFLSLSLFSLFLSHSQAISRTVTLAHILHASLEQATTRVPYLCYGAMVDNNK